MNATELDEIMTAVVGMLGTILVACTYVATAAGTLAAFRIFGF